MQLNSADKQAIRDGFKHVVVRGGKRVAYTTTAAEAKREGGKVYALTGMRYAAHNPSKRYTFGGHDFTDETYPKTLYPWEVAFTKTLKGTGVTVDDTLPFMTEEAAYKWSKSQNVKRAGYHPYAIYRRNPEHGSLNVRNPASKGGRAPAGYIVEPFTNDWGEKGWLAHGPRGVRVGFFVNKRDAIDACNFLSTIVSGKRNPEHGSLAYSSKFVHPRYHSHHAEGPDVVIPPEAFADKVKLAKLLQSEGMLDTEAQVLGVVHEGGRVFVTLGKPKSLPTYWHSIVLTRKQSNPSKKQAQLASLNRRIAAAERAGMPVDYLLEQRDLLVAKKRNPYKRPSSTLKAIRASQEVLYSQMWKAGANTDAKRIAWAMETFPNEDPNKVLDLIVPFRKQDRLDAKKRNPSWTTTALLAGGAYVYGRSAKVREKVKGVIDSAHKKLENPGLTPAGKRHLIKTMHKAGADTFRKKVAYVRRHMPNITDPQAFVGYIVKGER